MSAVQPVSQEEIGRRLREARLNVRLSQEQAAVALGLNRTALVKVEKGARAITSAELVRFATLYRRDLTELVSVEPLSDDPFTLLGRIAGEETPEVASALGRVLAMLKEAVRLEQFLGRPRRALLYGHALPAPENYEQATEQGKELARLERRRLGL